MTEPCNSLQPVASLISTLWSDCKLPSNSNFSSFASIIKLHTKTNKSLLNYSSRNAADWREFWSQCRQCVAAETCWSSAGSCHQTPANQPACTQHESILHTIFSALSASVSHRLYSNFTETHLQLCNWIDQYNVYIHKLPRRTAQQVRARRPGITTGFSQARSCHTRR